MTGWLGSGQWANRRVGRSKHLPDRLASEAPTCPGIYAALGLAPLMPDTVMRQDAERVIADFLELWDLVDDRPEVFLRAARIAGDGVRRIQGATQDLFDELGGPPGYQIAKGKSPGESMRPALLLGPVLAELMVWLQARHQEHEVFGRIVTYVEETLIQAGRVYRGGQLPAIAFIDLTGYTEMTALAGDERAAQSATMLQVLAELAVRGHRGRVVKLLGDGVMLQFASMIDAIDSVRDLMASIAAAGLPPAHAGIASGSVVVRDGDVYGYTVNLAARIASHAGSGELLIAANGVDGSAGEPLELVDVGSATLKGIAHPVPLLTRPARLSRTLAWRGLGSAPRARALRRVPRSIRLFLGCLTSGSSALAHGQIAGHSREGTIGHRTSGWPESGPVAMGGTKRAEIYPTNMER